MKVLAIINPVSGRRNLAGELSEVVRGLRRAGWAATVKLTRAGGDAGRLAGDADDQTRAILVVGGDGTVREVINGLLAAGRRIPLTILRNGTENLVAKELGQPVSPHAVVRTLLQGRPRPSDVGLVNGRRFLLVSGTGFDAEVVHRLAAVRRGHITHWDYFWPLLRTLGAHRFPSLRVEADGQQVFQGRGMAFVGVMARYSVGLRILRRARPDDGMLDLCIMPCESLTGLLVHTVGTLRRNHDRMAGVVYRKCQEVRIVGDGSVPMEIDGDPGGLLPAHYSVLPSAATFLAPPRNADP